MIVRLPLLIVDHDSRPILYSIGTLYIILYYSCMPSYRMIARNIVKTEWRKRGKCPSRLLHFSHCEKLLYSPLLIVTQSNDSSLRTATDYESLRRAAYERKSVVMTEKAMARRRGACNLQHSSLSMFVRTHLNIAAITVRSYISIMDFGGV